jgi:hypothetical protein
MEHGPETTPEDWHLLPLNKDTSCPFSFPAILYSSFIIAVCSAILVQTSGFPLIPSFK